MTYTNLTKAINEICKFNPTETELQQIIDAYKKDLKSVKTVKQFLDQKSDEGTISVRLHNVLSYNTYTWNKLIDENQPCQNLLMITQRDFMKQRNAGIKTWFEFQKLIKELK